jgi:FKBP-type peptidyl-prolyl cis-trans isomerase
MDDKQHSNNSGRRAFLLETIIGTSTSAAAAVLAVPSWAAAGGGGAQPDLKFQSTSSGLQWADVRVGTGPALSKGSTVTIDYSMSTTGARYGTKIYSTANTDNPYRFTLGDGSTIEGIEQAILGIQGVMEPMLPGGIRRLIIPSSLGYTRLAENAKERCVQSGSPGPIPPPNVAFEEYQRFKNIYCNPNRQYQPDLVLDVKLYGARSPSRQ